MVAAGVAAPKSNPAMARTTRALLWRFPGAMHPNLLYVASRTHERAPPHTTRTRVNVSMNAGYYYAETEFFFETYPQRPRASPLALDALRLLIEPPQSATSSSASVEQ